MSDSHGAPLIRLACPLTPLPAPSHTPARPPSQPPTNLPEAPSCRNAIGMLLLRAVRLLPYSRPCPHRCTPILAPSPRCSATSPSAYPPTPAPKVPSCLYAIGVVLLRAAHPAPPPPAAAAASASAASSASTPLPLARQHARPCSRAPARAYAHCASSRPARSRRSPARALPSAAAPICAPAAAAAAGALPVRCLPAGQELRQKLRARAQPRGRRQPRVHQPVPAEQLLGREALVPRGESPQGALPVRARNDAEELPAVVATALHRPVLLAGRAAARPNSTCSAASRARAGSLPLARSPPCARARASTPSSAGSSTFTRTRTGAGTSHCPPVLHLHTPRRLRAGEPIEVSLLVVHEAHGLPLHQLAQLRQGPHLPGAQPALAEHVRQHHLHLLLGRPRRRRRRRRRPPPRPAPGAFQWRAPVALQHDEVQLQRPTGRALRGGVREGRSPARPSVAQPLLKGVHVGVIADELLPHDTEGAVGEEALTLHPHHRRDPPPLRGCEAAAEFQRLPFTATLFARAACAQRVE